MARCANYTHLTATVYHEGWRASIKYRFQIVLAGFIAVLVLTNRLPGRSGQVAWLRLAVLAS